MRCSILAKSSGVNGSVAHEVVVEAVLGRRAERDLRAGIELLHRLRQHVRRVVAQQLERLRIARRHDADPGVVVDDRGEVLHLAVDLDGQAPPWRGRGRSRRRYRRRSPACRIDRTEPSGREILIMATTWKEDFEHELSGRREASAARGREAAQRRAPGRIKFERWSVSSGAGKNRRSMRLEIELRGRPQSSSAPTAGCRSSGREWPSRRAGRSRSASVPPRALSRKWPCIGKSTSSSGWAKRPVQTFWLKPPRPARIAGGPFDLPVAFEAAVGLGVDR